MDISNEGQILSYTWEKIILQRWDRERRHLNCDRQDRSTMCYCEGRFNNFTSHLSSILLRVRDRCKSYNDRAHYINKKAWIILAGHQIGFLDHTHAFSRGKYNTEEHLFSKYDGLQLNLKGKDEFISLLSTVSIMLLN